MAALSVVSAIAALVAFGLIALTFALNRSK